MKSANKKNFLKASAALTLLLIIVIWGGSNTFLKFKDFSLVFLSPIMNASKSFLVFWELNSFSDKEIKEILRTNEELIEKNFALALAEKDNEDLRKALEFKINSFSALKGAKVLFYSKELGNEFLIVSGGSQDGFKNGDLVINSAGMLVGTIKEVLGRFSKISLASNPNETFSVKLVDIEARAIAKGIGNRAFLVDLLVTDEPLRKGAFMYLTSGSLAKNQILVGTIIFPEKNLSSPIWQSKAVLLARPKILENVFVVKKEEL